MPRGRGLDMNERLAGWLVGGSSDGIVYYWMGM